MNTVRALPARPAKRGPIGAALLLVFSWAAFTLTAALLLGTGAALAWPNWTCDLIARQERAWINASQAWMVSPMLRYTDAGLDELHALAAPAVRGLLADGTNTRARLRAAWSGVQLAVLRGFSTFATLVPLGFLGLALASDGLVERDRRRWGADTESAWIYHFAKSAVLWWIGVLLLLRLTAPIALHPQLFLGSVALAAGPLLVLAFARFKKHL